VDSNSVILLAVQHFKPRFSFMEVSMKRIGFPLLVFCTCLTLAAWPQAQPSRWQQIVPFDAPDAGAGPGEGTFVNGINSGGGVVGWYVDINIVNHGLLRTHDGTIIEFDAPDAGTGAGQGTIAYGMNDGGAVTGYYGDAGNVVHSFLRTHDGTIIEFDAPDAGIGTGSAGCLAQFACQGTFAANINAAGEISGRYNDASGVPHAFVRDKHGNIVEFDAPGACQASGQGTQTSSFYGLNNAGWFAGPFLDCSIVWHGYLRAPDGGMSIIDAPGAGTGAGQGTIADCVSDNMAITGWYIDGNNANHGFVRGSHGGFTTIDGPGAGTGAGQGTLVADITPAGDIAGFYVDANNVAHGYSRDARGTFATFQAPGAGRGAGQGTYAVGNNTAGVTTGFYLDANNVAHGFLRN
jgi:catechol 2,3-dioxygenase-like lactoylglutathione lyase family enzyme